MFVFKRATMLGYTPMLSLMDLQPAVGQSYFKTSNPKPIPPFSKVKRGQRNMLEEQSKSSLYREVYFLK